MIVTAALIIVAAVLAVPVVTGGRRGRGASPEDQYRRLLDETCTTASLNAPATAVQPRPDPAGLQGGEAVPRQTLQGAFRAPDPDSRRRTSEDGSAGPSAPAADTEDQQQADGRMRALRSVLQQNQSDMADGQLSTLERVQKLMTSDAFTSYATFGRAGTDPEGADPVGDGRGPLPGG